MPKEVTKNLLNEHPMEIEIDSKDDNIVVFQTVKSPEEKQKPNKKYDITEHVLSEEQVVKLYDTNIRTGLSIEEANSRNMSQGLNQLKPPKQKSFLILYVGYMAGTFNILLGVTGVLCFILNAFKESFAITNYYLGAVLFFVVLFNSLVSSIQESKTQNVLKSFSNLISHHAMVLRGSN